MREQDENPQGDRPEEPRFEEIIESPKNYIIKNYAVVVDTMGQERLLTLAQRKYIFKIVKHLKKNVEDSENHLLNEIVQYVTDCDPNANKDFDMDYKQAKDKWLERLELPYSEEGRDAFIRWEAHRDAVLDTKNWDNVIKFLSAFSMIKQTQVIVALLYLFRKSTKAECMIRDPI